MRYLRYLIILLVIGSAQLLGEWDNTYTPELLFITAFICSLHTDNQQSVFVFFLAGICSDLFVGEHLGVNTFLYTTSALLMAYFRNTLQSKSTLLHLLILALTLLYLYLLKFIIDQFTIQNWVSVRILANNLLLSLLLTPALGFLLQLPIICPWKKPHS